MFSKKSAPALEEPLPRGRTQTRRAASKEALKQMQLLLGDEDDAIEIPDTDVSIQKIIELKNLLTCDVLDDPSFSIFAVALPCILSPYSFHLVNRSC